MENHIHPGHVDGGQVFLLSVEVDSRATGSFVHSTEKEGTRSAGRVVDGNTTALVIADTNNLGHQSAYLGGCIELSLALAGLGGEVPHQVFVSVTDQIVIAGTVGTEIEVRILEDFDEGGNGVYLVFSLAKFVFALEVCVYENIVQTKCVGEFCQFFVDFITNLVFVL